MGYSSFHYLTCFDIWASPFIFVSTRNLKPKDICKCKYVVADFRRSSNKLQENTAHTDEESNTCENMMTGKINEEKINFFSKRIKSGHIKVRYPTNRRYNYKQAPLSRRKMIDYNYIHEI